MIRIIHKQYGDKSGWAYWPQYREGRKWKYFTHKEVPWAIDEIGPIYGDAWWGGYIRKASMMRESFDKKEGAEKYIRKHLGENEEEYQEALTELDNFLL